MKRALLLCAAALSAPAFAAPIAITNAMALTARGEEVIRNATIIIDGGRITAIGAGLAVPAGATVIDAKGQPVTPGIVAVPSDLGLTEVGGVRETNDGSARSSPFSAALDMAAAINPGSLHFAIYRMAGVTRAAAVPDAGAGIFGGQGALLSLAVGGPTVTRA
ncbi:MAG: amidohydrolase, partial [Sandarakinorhabdus sp.]